MIPQHSDSYLATTFSRPINGIWPTALFFLVVVLSVMMISGCRLPNGGLNEAEAELAKIAKVTSVPTVEKPSPTPIPDHTRADAFVIATEVAVNKAKTTPTPTVDPVEEQQGSTFICLTASALRVCVLKQSVEF